MSAPLYIVLGNLCHDVQPTHVTFRAILTSIFFRFLFHFLPTGEVLSDFAEAAAGRGAGRGGHLPGLGGGFHS